MAQTGYTPISIYYSSTAGNTPTAGNLVAGELAINTADGKLFYKDSAGVVQVIAGKGGAGVAGGSNTQVQYNSSGSLAGSANMTFNGTTLTLANDASISGLTVGKGGGSQSGNTVLGNNAFLNNTTGNYCVALGYNALQANTTARNLSIGTNSSLATTTGGSNTIVGDSAFYTNTTGGSNSALGYQALFSNTTASNNTAVGYQAGYTNTTGANLVAIGRLAGYGNTTANDNTFVGVQSGYTNSTGTSNAFFGTNAGYTNNGSSNTALGVSALQSNTTASNNTAVGYQAGYSITTAGPNDCFGYLAGYTNQTGNTNVYIGTISGRYATGSNNTFLGYNSGGTITTGAKNTIIGQYSGNQGGLDIRTASNYIVLSDGDGNPLAFTANSNTFALQGGTISSGTGIAFPATQSASSNANTLDDYEEGTWTPTAFGASSTGTTTYSAQVGFYTKIGRQVTVSFYIAYSSLTGTGALKLGGLPFNVINVSNVNITGSLMTDQLNWTAGTSICLYCNQDSTYLSIYGSSDDGGWSQQQCVNETASIIGTITYFSYT